MNKKRVVFIDVPGQSGYLPLAGGYLIATAKSDLNVSNSISFQLLYPHPASKLEDILQSITSIKQPPELIAFSVQGWAIPFVDLLAARLAKEYPKAIIMYGGNHVTDQGKQLLQNRDYVKAICNGEGEFLFKELMLGLANHGLSDDVLRSVAGITFRTSEGDIFESPRRDRIQDIDEIPSPYLDGTLDLTKDDINTVLIETNRGCPYKCSFCYWGSATNSKVRKFSLDRVFSEMELFAQHEIESWYICDANFGMLKRDFEIVDKIIELKNTYGFPRVVHTNWAKHSNEKIVALVSKLNKEGIHSTFTVAAQSMDDHTLELAQRKNMAINNIKDLTDLCRKNNVVPRGELIFGLPGESYNTFLKSYDKIVDYTDAISVYPHYILPNTHYSDKRDKFSIKTEAAEFDTAYEYCTEHADMSRDDFIRGMKFIIANNIVKVGGNVFVVYNRTVNAVAGITQSQLLEKLVDWIPSSQDPIAKLLTPFLRNPLATHRHMLARVWNIIRDRRDDFLNMIELFADERIHSLVDPQKADILSQSLKYDFALYPKCIKNDVVLSTPNDCYESEYSFDYDFLSFQQGKDTKPIKKKSNYRIFYRKGLSEYPFDKWYFGFISFRGECKYVDEVNNMNLKTSVENNKAISVSNI